MRDPRKYYTREELDQYLAECVSVEPLMLQAEYVRLAADMAFWNERYARALAHFLELKAKRDRVYAHEYNSVRLEAQTSAKGKAPVASMEQDVLRSETYQAVVSALVLAEADKARLAGVLDAIRTKRDMLVSLGAHMRAEMAMTGVGGDKE